MRSADKAAGRILKGGRLCLREQTLSASLKPHSLGTFLVEQESTAPRQGKKAGDLLIVAQLQQSLLESIGISQLLGLLSAAGSGFSVSLCPDHDVLGRMVSKRQGLLPRRVSDWLALLYSG